MVPRQNSYLPSVYGIQARMSRRYQQKYQHVTRHRAHRRLQAVQVTVAVPPSANILGDLETSVPFGLSALSGKEISISKRISRTLIILEITLETDGFTGRFRRAVRKLSSRLERCAQRISPRSPAPSGGSTARYSS